MPTRRYIRANPETVQQLIPASEDRYWDGMELLVNGRECAGVYLFGYVAEMILKWSYFVTNGASASDRVRPLLGPVRAWGLAHLGGVGHESYHSLLFWTEAQILRRSQLGRPLDAVFTASLRQRAARLYDRWVVDLRYYPPGSAPLEGQVVYDDVSWIRSNKQHLV